MERFRTGIKRICALSLCVCLLLSVSFFASADTDAAAWGSQLDAIFTTEDLMDASIADLLDAMDRGITTSEEITRMYLDRIEAYDSSLKLNSFITVNPYALEEARAADAARAEGKAGRLLGIPIVVKDNLNVKGLPTTNGYSAGRYSRASSDSEVVRRLREEGAVIIGKGNMAAGSNTGLVTRSSAGGTAHNPYDLTRTPAGSSGGPAIAVTCNFAAAGIGTDTNSSIRRPASFANIYGYRPSAGLVSRRGMIVMNGMSDTAGILARSAEDTALILDIISGSDQNDRYSRSADELKPAEAYSDTLASVSFEDLKIGYVSNSFGYNCSYSTGNPLKNPVPLSDRVTGMVERALAVFTDNGAELVDISDTLPERYIRRLYWGSASNARKAMKEIFEELGLSAIVYISQTDVAEKENQAIGRNNNSAYYINVFSPDYGLPEIMVPMGLSEADPENGYDYPLPLGLSIVGLYGEDASLLALAAEYGRLSDMRSMPDTVPALADERLGQFASRLLTAASRLLARTDLDPGYETDLQAAYTALSSVSMSEEEEGREKVTVNTFRELAGRLCGLMDSVDISEPEEPVPEEDRDIPDPEPSPDRRLVITAAASAALILLAAAATAVTKAAKKKKIYSSIPSMNSQPETETIPAQKETDTMKRPILVIMAAGMGSRFGGLKQIAPVDDSGHIIMDYSLYDARRAGFEKVVFVIKKEIEDDFRASIGERIKDLFDVNYVFQDLNDLPEGFTVPEGRIKPWGTGHAVASCRDVIDAPFAVINADDFYGSSAFDMIYRFLSESDEEGRYCMAGFRLRNTLTENGSVARGQCFVQDGLLTGVTERTEIYPKGDDAEYRAEDGTMKDISGDTVVSMNFWGFSAGMAKELWRRFPAALEKGLENDPLKFEYYLPSVVNDQILDGSCTVTVLTCEDSWHGVTYTDDLPDLKKAIAGMREDGTYPVSLWDNQEP